MEHLVLELRPKSDFRIFVSLTFDLDLELDLDQNAGTGAAIFGLLYVLSQ